MPLSETIVSRENTRLIAARRVRDGKDRSLIFVEGTRLVREALSSQIDIEQCFFSESFPDEPLIKEVATRCSVTRVGEKAFSSIADTASPQGIVILARRPSRELSQLEQNKGDLPLIVYLFEINNPSNLGAVLRSADAAGAMGVITSPAAADPFSPKSLRSAMGSAFRIPVVEGLPFDKLRAMADGLSFELIALDVNGIIRHTSYKWNKRSILVLGSEGHGLPPLIVKKMAAAIRIDTNADVESLNLAVAAGVVLFEARRQVFSGSAT